MPKLNRLVHCSVTALLVAAAGAMVLPAPVAAQVVADRTLSDVNVDSVGGCTTLTVNFNIRVQVLSHFPTEGGRELHVRIRPLDSGTTNLLRESLRTPTSVPELRSIEYEGDNPSGPVLSLFFTRDMRFDVEAGSQPQSIVIRLDQPGMGPLCSAPAAPVMPTSQPAVVGGEKSPPPGVPIPAGLYAINLLSEPEEVGSLSDAQKQVISGRVVYEMLFERDSQHWHRLRMGFFETRDDAEAAKQTLLSQFPDHLR